MSLLQRSFRSLVPALALALPLFFCLNLNDTFDWPKLGLVYAAIAILLPWIFFDRLKTPAHGFFLTGGEWGAALILGAAALSTVYSMDRDISVMGFYRVHIFGLLPMTGFFLLCWITAQEETSDRLTLGLMLGGALTGAYALLQFQGLEIFDAMPRVVGGRPWSSLGNPVYLGAVCMMALVVTVGEFGRRRFDRWLLGFLSAAQGAGLVLSLSRSAWVGTFAGLLALAFLQKRKKLWKAAGLVLIAIILLIPSARHRAAALFSRSEESNAARLEGWRGALAVWREHPFIGSGPDTFFEAFRPHRSMAYIRATGPEVTQAQVHNDPLQIAATLGTLGLLAALVFLVTLGARVWTVCLGDRAGPAAPLAAACVALLVQDQFNFSSVATTAWAALALGRISRMPQASVTWAAWPRAARLALTSVALGLAVLFAGVLIVEWSADRQFQRGQELRQSGQTVLALIAFRDAARLRPGVETYQTEVGNTARTLATVAAAGSLRADLFQEAWAAAETNTRRHPRDPDAWNNQGVVAMWRNQLGGEATLKDAEAAFTHATQLDPLFVDAWANLAKWHHLQGDIDGEKRLWRVVLGIDPQHPMARAVLQQ